MSRQSTSAPIRGAARCGTSSSVQSMASAEAASRAIDHLTAELRKIGNTESSPLLTEARELKKAILDLTASHDKLQEKVAVLQKQVAKLQEQAISDKKQRDRLEEQVKGLTEERKLSQVDEAKLVLRQVAQDVPNLMYRILFDGIDEDIGTCKHPYTDKNIQSQLDRLGSDTEKQRVLDKYDNLKRLVLSECGLRNSRAVDIQTELRQIKNALSDIRREYNSTAHPEWHEEDIDRHLKVLCDAGEINRTYVPVIRGASKSVVLLQKELTKLRRDTGNS